MCSFRKYNKKLYFKGHFWGYLSLWPPCQLGSTFIDNIQQMWISDQGNLYQIIASHIDNIHIKYECSMFGIWRYWSLNIGKCRYKMNMKAPLTFNSAELTDHTTIIYIFLKSMQETVQVKIKSSTLVKLF